MILISTLGATGRFFKHYDLRLGEPSLVLLIKGPRLSKGNKLETYSKMTVSQRSLISKGESRMGSVCGTSKNLGTHIV